MEYERLLSNAALQRHATAEGRNPGLHGAPSHDERTVSAARLLRVVFQRGAVLDLEQVQVAQVDGETGGLAEDEYRVDAVDGVRSEEHTYELQSLMRISYAVFCLKKKNITQKSTTAT